MLSPQEMAALRTIDAHLSKTDPALAESLRMPPGRRPSAIVLTWPVVAAALLAVWLASVVFLLVTANGNGAAGFGPRKPAAAAAPAGHEPEQSGGDGRQVLNAYLLPS